MSSASMQQSTSDIDQGRTESSQVSAVVTFRNSSYVFYLSYGTASGVSLYYRPPDGGKWSSAVQADPRHDPPITIDETRAPIPIVLGACLYVFWNDKHGGIVYSKTSDMTNWSPPRCMEEDNGDPTTRDMERVAVLFDNTDDATGSTHQMSNDIDEAIDRFSDYGTVITSTSHDTRTLHGDSEETSLIPHHHHQQHRETSRIKKTSGRKAWLVFCFFVNILFPVEMNHEVKSMNDSTLLRVARTAREKMNRVLHIESSGDRNQVASASRSVISE